MLSRLGPACVWRLNIRMRNSTESGRKHPRAGGGWLRVQTVLVAAPDHKNSPHYRLEIKCEGRGRELDWTDCLGKYFLDKRYSMVYCLLVLCGHLVLRIYCYLEHNFPRCLSTALGIFSLVENLIVIQC